MACRGVLRPPYPAVLAVLEWAARNWAWIDGYLLARGTDCHRLDLSRFYNLLHYLMQEQASTDTEIMKARNRIRDDLLIEALKAEKIASGEIDEEELLAEPFPGLRESPRV